MEQSACWETGCRSANQEYSPSTELECSSPCSQQTVFELHPGLAESSSPPPLSSFKLLFNIIIPSRQCCGWEGYLPASHRSGSGLHPSQFLWNFWCSSVFLCQYHSTGIPFSLMPSGELKISPLKAAVQRHSLIPSTWTSSHLHEAIEVASFLQFFNQNSVLVSCLPVHIACPTCYIFPDFITLIEFS
jgi:hypothetical protein